MLSYLVDYESLLLLERVNPKIHLILQPLIEANIRRYQLKLNAATVNSDGYIQHLRHSYKPVGEHMSDEHRQEYYNLLKVTSENHHLLLTWKGLLYRSQIINRGALI